MQELQRLTMPKEPMNMGRLHYRAYERLQCPSVWLREREARCSSFVTSVPAVKRKDLFLSSQAVARDASPFRSSEGNVVASSTIFSSSLRSDCGTFAFFSTFKIEEKSPNRTDEEATVPAIP